MNIMQQNMKKVTFFRRITKFKYAKTLDNVFRNDMS